MCCNEIIKERLIRLRNKYGEEKFKKMLIGTNPGQVSRQSYEHWMKGDRTPSAANIKSICEMFSISSDWLLGFLPENCSTNNIDVQNAAKYTGLSDKSVIALHRMRYGTEKYHAPDIKGIDFLNMALEQTLEDDLKDDKHAELLLKKFKPERISSKRIAYQTVFAAFFELVSPSVDLGALYLLKPEAPNDPEDPGEWANAATVKRFLLEREISRFFDGLRLKYAPDYAYWMHTSQADEGEIKRANAEIREAMKPDEDFDAEEEE